MELSIQDIFFNSLLMDPNEEWFANQWKSVIHQFLQTGCL